MAPPESTPAKKRCTSTNRNKIRPLECVRKFQLPRQFPSTKQALRSGTSIVNPVTSTLTLPNAVTVSSNPENRVPYNLQKLRILSPGGKDLGEFNVELLSADPTKGNTIMITKSNLKSVDKPLILPLSPISHTKTLPRILRQGTAKIPRRNLMEAISCSRDVSSDNTSVLQQSTLNKMLLNGQNTEGKKTEKQICSNGINANKARSTDEVSSKHSICQTVNSNNQKYIINSGIDTRNCIKIEEIESKEAETLLYKKIIESPRSANSKKLTINFSNRNSIPLSGSNLKVSKGKCIATIKNTENGKIVTSLKSAANLVQRCNRIDKNLNQNSLHNNSRKSFNNDEVSYDRNNSFQIKSEVVPKAEPEIKTQNVMTIIPNNKALLFNQNAVLTQECNSSLASTSTTNITKVINHDTVRHNTKCNNMQNEGLKTGSRNDRFNGGSVRRISEPQRITNIGANVQSDAQSNDRLKDLPQKNLSDRLNIIKKAMDSVKDNELRDLALKALADCGIGIERYVPIRPPEDYKAVHDTQVQTIVFGLLDPKSFILINKDLNDIHRLNQITLHDMPDDENLLPVDDLHSNVVSDVDFVSKDSNVIESDVVESNIIESNVIERESPFDLDSFMEQFWKEDSDALKMKETLSMTKIRCNNLLEHLQRDFECVKRYDQNGMLNIHNAVISDNVYLVRRQLMILQHCKQSVDILTEDGVVS